MLLYSYLVKLFDIGWYYMKVRCCIFNDISLISLEAHVVKFDYKNEKK